jgi:hypothetical protein
MAEFIHRAMLSASVEARATASRAVSALRFVEDLPQLDNASEHLLKFIGANVDGGNSSMLMQKLDAIQTNSSHAASSPEANTVPAREELETFEGRDVYQGSDVYSRRDIVPQQPEEFAVHDNEDAGGEASMEMDEESVSSETSQTQSVEERLDKPLVDAEHNDKGGKKRKRLVLRPYKSRTNEMLKARLVEVKRTLTRVQRMVQSRQLQFNRLESEVQYRILDGKMADSNHE